MGFLCIAVLLASCAYNDVDYDLSAVGSPDTDTVDMMNDVWLEYIENGEIDHDEATNGEQAVDTAIENDRGNPEIDQNDNDLLDWPDYDGEQAHAFYAPFGDVFYFFPREYTNHVGKELFFEWLEQQEKFPYGVFSVGIDANLKTFVEYFNISKEQLFLLSEGLFHYITHEMIDALYSNDIECIFNAYPSAFSVLYNGKVYPPAWFAENSYEDCVKEGLPDEVIFKSIIKNKKSFKFFSTEAALRTESILTDKGFKAEDYINISDEPDIPSDKEFVMPTQKPHELDELIKNWKGLSFENETLPAEYYQPYSSMFIRIPHVFSDYVGVEGFLKWLFTQDITNIMQPDNPRPDTGLANFLAHFGISRETFREIYPPDKEYEEIWGVFTEEMLDALYSDDIEFICSVFPNPYTVLHDGKAYSPGWFASHSYEDYIAEGLPMDVVFESISRGKEAFPEEMAQVEAILSSRGITEDKLP